MDKLWKTLVPDGKAAVKRYLDAVLADLCEALGSRKWRERQGAALALADMYARHATSGSMYECLYETLRFTHCVIERYE